MRGARLIEPELLDELPADDPRAIWSRRDLRRVNTWMGHAGYLQRTLSNIPMARPPRRIVELGAGDGTFMLRLAERMAPVWNEVEVLLVDRQNLLSASTAARFQRIGWKAEPIQADVFDWLAGSLKPEADLLLANLFLHHFSDEQLRALFEQVARRTGLFVACEPRRSSIALLGARLLWMIGCNGVTRHDAVISVRASFDGHELSNLWPSKTEWLLHEFKAGFFSHCLCARRIG